MKWTLKVNVPSLINISSGLLFPPEGVPDGLRKSFLRPLREAQRAWSWPASATGWWGSSCLGNSSDGVEFRRWPLGICQFYPAFHLPPRIHEIEDSRWISIRHSEDDWLVVFHGLSHVCPYPIFVRYVFSPFFWFLMPAKYLATKRWGDYEQKCLHCLGTSSQLQAVK